MQNETLKTTRRSTRSYAGEAIPRDVLMKILIAGMVAPSIIVHPWNFVIVTERSILNSLGAKIPHAKMLHKAKAALIICGTPDKDELYGRDAWVMDYAAMTRNVLLVSNAMGLGAVWLGVYPSKERIATVRGILNIPEEVVPVNVIPICVPSGTGSLTEKFEKENIHWEGW